MTRVFDFQEKGIKGKKEALNYGNQGRLCGVFGKLEVHALVPTMYIPLQSHTEWGVGLFFILSTLIVLTAFIFLWFIFPKSKLEGYRKGTCVFSLLIV